MHQFKNSRSTASGRVTDYSSTGDVVAAKRIAWEWMSDFTVIRTDESYRRLRPDVLIAKSKAAYAWQCLYTLESRYT